MSKMKNKRRDKLSSSAKFTIIKQLAEDIAHEIRNPLAVITTSTFLIEKHISLIKLDEKTKIKEWMDSIKYATSKILDFVNSLTSIYKTEDLKFNIVSLNNIIKKALKEEKFISENDNILVKEELDLSLPKMLLDEDRICRMIKNIIQNSYQAMLDKGVLEITSRFLEKEKAAEIIIRDTGKGISKDNLKYIFDPFFSTKKGKELGLGLTLSKKIVEGHKGKIKVSSKNRAGTTVKIKLPINSEIKVSKNS